MSTPILVTLILTAAWAAIVALLWLCDKITDGRP